MGDDADTIFLKFKKAKTDAGALPSEIPGLKNRPEAENLITIYSALSNQSIESTLKEVGGKPFSEFKPILAERAVELLSPISTEMNRLMQNSKDSPVRAGRHYETQSRQIPRAPAPCPWAGKDGSDP